jgi:hypothetical protein
MHDGYDLFGANGVQTNVGSEMYSPDTGQWHAHDSVPKQEPFSAPDFDVLNGRWQSEADLARLLQASAYHDEDTRPTLDLPPHALRPPTRHRRSRYPLLKTAPKRAWTRAQILSLAIASLIAALVAMVSALSGIIAHDPLRHLASPAAPQQLTTWWPALIYGPWMVASLSILRHAVHHRRAPHSWAIVLLFSAFAVILCIAYAPKTVAGVTVAALPSVAALSCFHQLSRQITLTKPSQRRVPGQRRAPGSTQRPT